MSELDLTTAIGAGREALKRLVGGDVNDWPDFHGYSETVVAAALPYILDALAAKAEADTVRLFLNEREKCSDWLQAKAAEARER